MEENPGDGYIDEISEVRRAMEDELLAKSPVYAQQVHQMAAIYGEQKGKGGIDQTHRILIALAMAVQSGPQSAVEWTVTRALNHGATEKMISDAIDIALLNGGTFAVANARFAYQALRVRRVRPASSKPRVFQPQGDTKG